MEKYWSPMWMAYLESTGWCYKKNNCKYYQNWKYTFWNAQQIGGWLWAYFG